MKILFVSSGNFANGMTSLMQTQGESLKEFGLEPDYFTIQGKGLRGYLKNLKWLRDSISSKNYDIIHAHYGLCGWLSLAARRKEKLIVSFMGDDIVGSNKENGAITLISIVMAKFNILLAEYVYNHSIVKSAEMLAKFNKKERLSLIPNGVNLDLFQTYNRQEARQKLNLPNNKKLLIFVSDPLRTEKNYLLAEHTVKLLLDQDVVLMPVLGKNAAELVNFYNAADALILTSFHEGSPNVIKEAMACNCPIVSTDVGDVKWVFGKTEGCFLTSFKVEDVAKKIEAALCFSANHRRTAGRDRIIELGLDSESIAKKIVDVYKRVLN